MPGFCQVDLVLPMVLKAVREHARVAEGGGTLTLRPRPVPAPYGSVSPWQHVTGGQSQAGRDVFALIKPWLASQPTPADCCAIDWFVPVLGFSSAPRLPGISDPANSGNLLISSR